VQEGLHVAEFADEVVIAARSEFRASDELLERARERGDVELMEGVDLADYVKKTPFDGYFVFAGMVPSTGFLPAEVLDEEGFVVTSEGYETGISGVFAAGSVRRGAVSQVVTGVGEGVEAALAIDKKLKV
jgi:thioredoxin reductase (NADPH)